MKFYLKDLKQLAKDNKIIGVSQMRKGELIALLINKKIINIPHEDEESGIRERAAEVERLRYLSSKPREVIITNLQTIEKKSYPSVYKAAKDLNINPGTISSFNGRNWRGIYHFEIL